jgi:hypothetical protein
MYESIDYMIAESIILVKIKVKCKTEVRYRSGLNRIFC